jgi:hypothetical protein
MVKHVMVPATVLPKKARLMLCSTCKIALEQLHEPAISGEVCC